VTEVPEAVRAPIENPFTEYHPKRFTENAMIVRTRNGERSLEIELPNNSSLQGQIHVPIHGRSTPGESESVEGVPSWKDRKPVATDREILSELPQTAPELLQSRQGIERTLGLTGEDLSHQENTSYLARLDHVKQLYKKSRFEAAILEIDEMISFYPYDPKLHRMRGTLLDRMGKSDLALRSWKQALELKPEDQGLSTFIQRREKQLSRAPASGGAP
jgi:tetratricopeptide (TPR) repeat protein